MILEVAAVQQTHLGEEHRRHERNLRQLLQTTLHSELVPFLLHHECHDAATITHTLSHYTALHIGLWFLGSVRHYRLMVGRAGLAVGARAPRLAEAVFRLMVAAAAEGGGGGGLVKLQQHMPPHYDSHFGHAVNMVK